MDSEPTVGDVQSDVQRVTCSRSECNQFTIENSEFQIGFSTFTLSFSNYYEP